MLTCHNKYLYWERCAFIGKGLKEENLSLSFNSINKSQLETLKYVQQADHISV